MKYLQRFISLVLVLALLCALAATVSAATGPKFYNTGHRETLCTELSQQAEDYYTGSYSYELLSALSGAQDNTDSYRATLDNELYAALYTLMSKPM